jgi:predicted AAA+ superfamily ATPase
LYLVKAGLPEYVKYAFPGSTEPVRQGIINLAVAFVTIFFIFVPWLIKVGPVFFAREFTRIVLVPWLPSRFTRRFVSPFDIDFVSLSSTPATATDFKYKYTVHNVEQIGCFNGFINEHIISNKHAKLGGGVECNIDMARMFDINGRFEFEKGCEVRSANKYLTYTFVPVWRWGNEANQCVYMSCSASGLVDIYTNNQVAAVDFIKYVTGKYGVAKVNTGNHSNRQLQIYDTKRTANNVRLVAQEETIDRDDNFNDLFYPQKQQLLEDLAKFSRGEFWPKKTHRHNLGIFLYGKPGCGKTTTIRAVANMFNRDVHLINLSLIKSTTELEDLLKMQKVDQKIIVFEEIDLMLDALEDKTILAGDNEAKNELLIQASRTAELAQRQKIIDAAKNMDAEKNMQVNLRWFLTWLDGVCKSRGRIIIATTNRNIADFESRLFRSGRFDLKIELDYCTQEMFREIISNICEDEPDLHLLDEVTEWPVNQWPPSTLVTLCALARCSIPKILDVLKNSSPVDFEQKYFTFYK